MCCEGQKCKSGGILYRITAVKNFFSKNSVAIVLGLTTLLLIIGWFQKLPCRDGHWNGQQYSKQCYSDIVALYSGRNLSKGQIPYIESDVEYPVLLAAFMGVVGVPIHSIGEDLGKGFNQVRAFFTVNSVLLSLAVLATAGLLLHLRTGRHSDILLFALSPLLIVSTTINWDMLAVLPSIAAIFAWSRKKPALAGFLIGVGIAAKFWPVVLLFPIALLGIRTDKIQESLKAIVSAIGTWIIINLPVAILFPDAWQRFFQFSAERGLDWGSLWYIVRHFGVQGLSVPTLNMWFEILFAVSCIGIALLTFYAKKKPRLSQLLFLTVAFFLMTGKVWSPQFVLWLIPFAVLARPRVHALVLWQAAELFYFWAVFTELAGIGGTPIISEWTFIVASLARLLTLALVCGYIVYDILKPRHDLIRKDGTDDPDGGVFDKAPDSALVVQMQKMPAMLAPSAFK
jgi:uncharacterized membrane protein